MEPARQPASLSSIDEHAAGGSPTDNGTARGVID